MAPGKQGAGGYLFKRIKRLAKTTLIGCCGTVCSSQRPSHWGLPSDEVSLFSHMMLAASPNRYVRLLQPNLNVKKFTVFWKKVKSNLFQFQMIFFRICLQKVPEKMQQNTLSPISLKQIIITITISVLI